MRAHRQAVQIAVLAALALCGPVTAAHAALFASETDGTWTTPAVWINQATMSPGVPGPGDTAVISENDAVTLPSGVTTVGNLFVIRGGSVHFQGEQLVVTGDLTVGDSVGAGGLLSTVGQGALTVQDDIEIVSATVDDVDIAVSSGGSDHSTTLAAAGTSTWSGASLTQTAGTASLAGHAATGLALTLERVAATVSGANTVGNLTLTAPTGAGSLAFHTPTGAGARLTAGAFTASGTQTVTTTWTGTPAHGGTADLLTKTSGSFTGLTTTNEQHTDYTAGAATLSAQYVVYANTAAPTVTTSNSAAGLAAAGDTLTCQPGTWTETSTYAYAWRRDGAPIPGAAASTHTVTTADEGHSLTCAVTGAGTPSSRTATASAATAITVPAAPQVTITSAPPETVTTPTTTVAFAAATGTTVTGCTLDDAPVSCQSPLTLSGYANGSRPRLRITGRNAAGATTVASASFAVRLPPALTVGAAPVARGGEPVTLAIQTDAGATVACAYAGAPVACTASGVTVAAPPVGNPFALTVTATSATGTTTVSRTLTSTAAAPLPSPIVMPVGETVTVPSASYLGAGPASRGYQWHGPLRVTWTGQFTDPSSWGLRVTAPKTPGRSRQTLTWYAEPGTLNAFTIQAFDPAKAAATRAPGGITSSRAPLTCPLGGSGTTYTWWVNGEMVPGQTRRALPASAVPKTAAIFCTARIAETGQIVLLRVLVDRGARLAGLTFARALAMIASDNVRAEIVSMRGGRPVGRTRVQLRRGTTKVPVPAAATSFTVRIVRASGGKSRPLTITRPS